MPYNVLRFKKISDSAPPSTGQDDQVVFFREETNAYHALLCADDSGDLIKFADSRFTKSINLLTPVSGDSKFFFYAHDNLTLLELYYAVRGGTSVDFTVYKVEDFGGSPTTTQLATIDTASGQGTMTLSATGLSDGELLYVEIDDSVDDPDELFVQARITYK